MFLQNEPSNMPVFHCIYMLRSEKMRQNRYRNTSITGIPFALPALHLKRSFPIWNWVIKFVTELEISFPFFLAQSANLGAGTNLCVKNLSHMDFSHYAFLLSILIPDGLETMLSREFDGVDLSGGQWQRVSIARGINRDSKVIVLDEPTKTANPNIFTKSHLIFLEFLEYTGHKSVKAR